MIGIVEIIASIYVTGAVASLILATYVVSSDDGFFSNEIGTSGLPNGYSLMFKWLIGSWATIVIVAVEYCKHRRSNP